ncbi:MAG: SDR family oxidoreductase [Prolixibacteraceae bacterium]|jgi:NAD(P)-dependent dehydrogenase (short-subunit alcohol dehydrogenase family)|nr:SDR family oxidoreductase [Prolixibacteraceae bacterium]MDI9563980.1 SDR family oxidoreductase [Bacteroidota bacterium]NLS99168.1 SDR family oxidoreductase [Bacteroidales bacterium]OQB82183.1 MAG: 3-oxoacyl-(acyl-carrier-protein) reductase FabG [Bacteroidetes bacterium ADurb.Bin123]HNZ69967.1 SDR family oxidoreductase [Prolixibacteraceae bacterium]
MGNDQHLRKQGIALITGAARRIGKAMAGHLAAGGWDIAIHFNRSTDEAETFARQLAGHYSGQSFMIFQADLHSAEETERLVPRVIEKMGKPRLLINNASVFDPGTLLGTSTGFFDRQMGVNLRAPFILMREFINLCEEGVIINMADTRITGNRQEHAAYTLSKKALWELTKMAAAAYGPSVRVNAIAPGLTLPPEGKGETYLQKLSERIPMKKPGGIRPILNSLDYILKNDYLTGQLFFCDGGEHLI